MAEQDPFASPYHHVVLPGQQQEHPPGWVSPVVAPMPLSPWETREHRRPATVTASFWCWFAATLLVVLGMPGVFALQYEQFAQVLVDGSTAGEPIDLPTAKVGALLTAGVFALALAVLSTPFVVAFINLRGGKQWARVMLAILGALGLVFGLAMVGAFTGGSQDLNPTLGYLCAALFLLTTLAAIVLMFLPPSNDYVRGTAR
ncbi:hypothetical protein [Umezawaea sp. NPDC059074]|uniref:hypothetical protein n=1 Tax=Umezawaea sp. NPDC059074 TaxID=3346716 RepID=UPI0036A19D60